jgi:hypothetical protein
MNAARPYQKIGELLPDLRFPRIDIGRAAGRLRFILATLRGAFGGHESLKDP